MSLPQAKLDVGGLFKAQGANIVGTINASVLDAQSANIDTATVNVLNAQSANLLLNTGALVSTLSASEP